MRLQYLPFKVGKVPADKALRDLFENVKHDPRVEAINVPDVLSEAIASKDKLVALKGQIVTWGIQGFDSKKKSAERLLKEFDENFAKLIDYKETLTILNSKKKAGMDAQKRHGRYVVSTIKKQLTDGNCPESYAQNLASFLESVLDADDFITKASTAYEAEYKDDTISLQRPAMFTRTPVGSDSSSSSPEHTARHLELEAATKWRQQNYLKVFADAVNTLSEWRQFLFPLATVEKPLTWPNDDKGKAHKQCTVGYALVSWCFNLSMEFMPLPGVPGFATVLRGCCVMCVIDLSSLQDDDFSIDGLARYITDSGVPALSKFPTFALQAGQSLFVPFGHVLISVAVPSEDFEGCLLSVTYILDADHANKCDSPLRAEIKAAVSKRMLVKSGTVDYLKQGVKKYLAAFTESDE